MFKKSLYFAYYYIKLDTYRPRQLIKALEVMCYVHITLNDYLFFFLYKKTNVIKEEEVTFILMKR